MRKGGLEPQRNRENPEEIQQSDCQKQPCTATNCPLRGQFPKSK
jgi:hypothetical protein